jgi:hypothetical protein
MLVFIELLDANGGRFTWPISTGKGLNLIDAKDARWELTEH